MITIESSTSAVVLLLSATVLSQSVLHTVDGPAPSAQFGLSVRAIGDDVDADGVVDWMAATSTELEVLSGADGSVIHQLGPSPNWSGDGITAVGDLDGDLVADLAVGRPTTGSVTVYSAVSGAVIMTITPPASPPQLFGAAVGSLGDVNGDGVPEILVGQVTNSGAGLSRAYVISGATAAVIHTVFGVASFDGFGGAVAGLVDLDGDGCDDFAVGSTNGAVTRVFSGATASILLSTTSTGPVSRIRPFDDLDLDGSPDILVAAVSGPRVVSSTTGAVLLDLPLATPVNVRYPASLDAVGDWNGDGISEILASGYDFSGSPGSPATVPGFVRLHSGFDGTLLFSREGTTPDERFGFACSRAGDVNGDGEDDILVGAPALVTGSGQGRVFVLYRGRHPGSAEDLELYSGQNGVAILGPDAFTLPTPAILTLRIATAGTFHFHPYALVADIFSVTSPPPAIPVPAFPEVHVRPPMAVVLFDSLSGPAPIGPAVLVPGGVSHSYAVPALPPGIAMIVQGLVATSTAANGFFAITTGHEISF